jgi:DNA replicative helicase MCM subunit Mcm2 (Cdc46/Mcm family)
MARRYKQARFVCRNCGAVKTVDIRPTGRVPVEFCDDCGRPMYIFRAVRDQPKAES